jgi:hypothetical protein
MEVDESVLQQFMNTDSRFNNYRPQMDPKDTVSDSEVLIPLAPIPMDIIYDIARYSDVLRTMFQHLRKAIFKNGYEVKENFSKKCVKCEKEFENPTEECDECGSKELRDPDVSQKKKLVRFLKSVNDNDQDLIKVSKHINDDLETLDDGYLLCIKEFYHSAEGELLGAIPVELIRMDARWVRLVADKTGLPGFNDNGDKLTFCPDHRDTLQRNIEKCPMCNKDTMQCFFRSEIPDGKYYYYAQDEVCHKSKYNPSLTYGFSIIYAVWNKVITLMNMDQYMKNYYAKQRPPRGLLFVNTPNMEGLEKAWNWMTDEFKKNPHQIPPIAVEQVSGSKGNLVNFIDFMKSPEEMQFIDMRNEFRRQIGAPYGIMPLFQADLSQSGGLNNEGLQITVTNQAIEDGQAIYNDEYYPWICDQFGVTDYHIELLPHEEQDLVHEEDLKAKKIDNAKKMQDLGYDVTYTAEEDFEFDPVDEVVEPKEQMNQFGFGGLGKPPEASQSQATGTQQKPIKPPEPPKA